MNPLLSSHHRPPDLHTHPTLPPILLITQIPLTKIIVLKTFDPENELARYNSTKTMDESNFLGGQYAQFNHSGVFEIRLMVGEIWIRRNRNGWCLYTPCKPWFFIFMMFIMSGVTLATDVFETHICSVSHSSHDFEPNLNLLSWSFEKISEFHSLQYEVTLSSNTIVEDFQICLFTRGLLRWNATYLEN